MAQVRRYVVIGCGILGASLALFLAERGAKVTLLEKNEPGQGATQFSLAWLNANNKRRPSYYQLNVDGMATWVQLAKQLDGDTWYRPVGNLEWRVADEDRISLIDRVERLSRLGYPAHLVDSATATRLEPQIRTRDDEREFAWFPSEGYVITETLIKRLLTEAARRGVTILTGRRGKVIDFVMAGNEISAVRTAAAEVIPCDTLVFTAGHWTSRLAAMLDGYIPLISPEKKETTPAGVSAAGFIVRAKTQGKSGLSRILHTPGINLRPHADGIVHLEPSGVRVDLDTTETEIRALGREVLSRAQQAVTCLTDAEILEQRVCARPVPVDGYPVVGWLPGLIGIYATVTHSAITLGAHLARLAVSELVDDLIQDDLADYRPDRSWESVSLVQG